LAGLAAVQTAQATTEVTFGGFTANNVDISTLAGYGDNVTASDANYTVSLGVGGAVGTPNIALDWGAGYQTYTSWDGRGNVAQADFGFGTNINLTFTPELGYGVLLESFVLDEWAGGGDVSVSWSVFDAQGTLASGTWLKSTAGGRDQVPTGLAPGDIRLNQPVTLRFTLNSGEPSYIALDNLTFSQVPEPSVLALGLLGLGALALRRRR
jgi:hypothetical protein